MLYVAQREDGNRLGFAADIDPEYALGVSAAVATGVELLCYRCSVDVGAIRLEDAIAIDLPTALPACKTMTSHME